MLLGFVILNGCGGTVDVPHADVTSTEIDWPTYGQNQSRTFFNSHETRITRATVGGMRFKWRYLTGAVVTASPTVAQVNVPGERRVKIVFVVSWDGNFYALRASNGTRLWSYVMKPHPGASFPYASSAEVVTVAGEQRVYVAGGMTVYAFVAATGQLRWQFDAGTGCTDCDFQTERNEVLSSPTKVGDLIIFAMDVNEGVGGKGGAFAVNAVDGRLVWYFDLETAATCRPLASDNVRRFDGYHTAAQLGLPDDFFATRPGCRFDRHGNQCGNVWSSFAIDYGRRLIYTVSSNCDSATVPPMPPYDEAIFALTFDGAPVWVWRPRDVDPLDLDFGAVPNLFDIEIGGATRAVVGVGGKDGTYYLLDRDGVNELTGRLEPYWQRKTVPGGKIGGIIASAAVGNGEIFFGTAIGTDIQMFQEPAAWALHATDGSVRWSKRVVPSFGPTTAVPGVVFHGVVVGNLVAHDADDGTILAQFPLDGPASSGAAIVDGEIFVGAGTGARGGSPAEQAFKQSTVPSYISALCLPDSSDCPDALCDDGNVCTFDFHAAGGACSSEAAPDGIVCTTSGARPGICQNGQCRAL